MKPGSFLKQVVAGKPLDAADEASRLTAPPMTDAPPPPALKSLTTQAGDLGAVFQEMERVIVGIETRISGFQAEAEDHAAPEGAALGGQLRYLGEYAADLTGRLEGILKTL